MEIYLLATGWIVQEDVWGGVKVWLFGGVVGGVGGTFNCSKCSKHGNGASNLWSSSNFLLLSLNFCMMLTSYIVSIIFFLLSTHFVTWLFLCVSVLIPYYPNLLMLSVFSIVMYSLNPVIIV